MLVINIREGSIGGEESVKFAVQEEKKKIGRCESPIEAI